MASQANEADRLDPIGLPTGTNPIASGFYKTDEILLDLRDGMTFGS